MQLSLWNTCLARPPQPWLLISAPRELLLGAEGPEGQHFCHLRETLSHQPVQLLLTRMDGVLLLSASNN